MIARDGGIAKTEQPVAAGCFSQRWSWHVTHLAEILARLDRGEKFH